MPQTAAIPSARNGSILVPYPMNGSTMYGKPYADQVCGDSEDGDKYVLEEVEVRVPLVAVGCR